MKKNKRTCLKKLVRCKIDHSELDFCEPCPKCGTTKHKYTDEPYCDLCAAPYKPYYDAIKKILS